MRVNHQAANANYIAPQAIPRDLQLVAAGSLVTAVFGYVIYEMKKSLDNYKIAVDLFKNTFNITQLDVTNISETAGIINAKSREWEKQQLEEITDLQKQLLDATTKIDRYHNETVNTKDEVIAAMNKAKKELKTCEEDKGYAKSDLSLCRYDKRICEADLKKCQNKGFFG